MPVILANVLQPLIDVFESVLKFFHDSVGLGWGVSIICLTIVVRAVMLPLAVKQYRSMQGLQRLQPQMKELQRKYKDDKQRLNQEMAEFYRKNKVNPFGSCLPLVAQLPVFISLYYMLRTDLRYDICPQINPPSVSSPKACGAAVDAAHFLGISDITSRATGVTLVVLLCLYVGSQLLSSLLMAQANADRNQRLIFLALPFVFVIFIQRFPAGLLVYWITTNLWTVAQQFSIRELMKHPIHEPAPAEGTSGGAPPGATATVDGDGASKTGGGLFGSLMGRAADAGAKPAAEREKAATGAGKKQPTGRASAGTKGPPPRSPRKKKKRSGRRR